MNVLDAQRQLVQKLDAELKRLEQLDIPEAVDHLPTQVLEPGVSKGMPRLEAIKAWDAPEPPEVVAGPEQAAHFDPLQSAIQSPVAFNSLSATVKKERRKHMSWIHKNADLPKAAKAPRTTQPVFSQLHAQFATDKVRQAAIEEFDNNLVDAPAETQWTTIVQHAVFERVSLLMIYLNAMWLAVDIEFNNADVVWQAEPIFIIVEIIFVIYFVGEAFLRYMAYASTIKAVKDPWFIFDLLLVLMMLLETWIVPMFLLILPNSGTAWIGKQEMHTHIMCFGCGGDDGCCGAGAGGCACGCGCCGGCCCYCSCCSCSCCYSCCCCCCCCCCCDC